MNIIRLKNLTKNYEEREVLKKIDLTIDHGELVVLLGKNGAGKSTLFKILTGLARPSSGEITLFNDSLSFSATQKQIGFNINEPIFYEELSASENLSIHCEYMGVSSEKVDFWLKRVGLDSNSQTIVKKFSLGMRQRLALARCFIHEPNLIILDEPLNGLDPKGIKDLRSLLKDMLLEGKTIILSSHILTEVRAIATRVVVITDGTIVCDESKEHLEHFFPNQFEDYLISKMEGHSDESYSTRT